MNPAARTVLLAAASLALTVVFAATPASAAVSLTRISTDPFTNSTSQHRTQVEPDTYSFGSTIVSAFQSGRFFDGGSSGIGWATSTNGGSTWQNGFLPGLTRFTGGPYDRASDPSVAFDARHNAWLISSLVIRGNSPVGVVTSRSTDGGRTWSAPITVTSGSSDKNWIVCDNTTTSPFYGRCYTEWDRPSSGSLLLMSTSTNGGLSWGPARATADSARGLGGQPVVQPNGTVIVPTASPSLGSILAFRSVDGGATWRRSVQVATLASHTVAGSLRSPPLPSAEVDAAGNVFVVWQDCRFRASCRSNDLVLSTTTQSGYPTWTPVRRIPIDPTTSTVDHFIPGVAVDRGTSGATARVALAYYFYPSAACSFSTCQLDVGYVSSRNGGSTWSAPTQLAGPMALSWLPSTSGGRMVGDYISTSFSNGSAHPVFAVASAPVGGLFNEAMFTPTMGLP
jgi:BNR repeat protein